jgi:hypothetical protein
MNSRGVFMKNWPDSLSSSERYHRAIVIMCLKFKQKGNNSMVNKILKSQRERSSKDCEKIIRECKRQWALGNRGDDWMELSK